jgi:WD40 repeat protein
MESRRTSSFVVTASEHEAREADPTGNALHGPSFRLASSVARFLARHGPEGTDRLLEIASQPRPVDRPSPGARWWHRFLLRHAPALRRGGVQALHQCLSDDARTAEAAGVAACLPDDGASCGFRRVSPPSLLARSGLEQVLVGHRLPASSLEPHPDGRRLFSAGMDGLLRVWDLRTNRCLRAVEAHGGRTILALALSPDGQWLASAGADAVVRIWEVESGECVHELATPELFLEALAVHSDGRRVAGLSRTTLVLWDLVTHQVIHTEPLGKVTECAFAETPRGWLLACSTSRTVRLFDLDARVTLDTLSYNATFDLITGLAISADGRALFSVGWMGELRRWDLIGGRSSIVREGVPVMLVPFSSPAQRFRLSADGTSVVAALDSRACSISLVGDAPVAPIESAGCVMAVAGLSDGQRLALSTLSGRIAVTAVAARPGARRSAAEHSAEITGLAVCRRGAVVASCSLDTTLRFWSVETGDLVGFTRGFRIQRRPNGLHEVHQAQNPTPLLALAMLPDGTAAVLTGQDGSLRVWDVAEGQARSIMRQGQSFLTAVAVHPAGRRAVAGTYDGQLCEWDLEQQRQLCSWPGHSGGISDLCVHANGDLLFSAGTDGKLRLWDLPRHVEIDTISLAEGSARALALHPDHRHLLSAGSDGRVQVWDRITRRSVEAFGDPGLRLNVLDLSPDGRQLVAGSEEGVLWLWDLHQQRMVGRWYGELPITACCFARRERIVVGDALGQLHFLAPAGRRGSTRS